MRPLCRPWPAALLVLALAGACADPNPAVQVSEQPLTVVLFEDKFGTTTPHWDSCCASPPCASPCWVETGAAAGWMKHSTILGSGSYPSGASGAPVLRGAACVQGCALEMAATVNLSGYTSAGLTFQRHMESGAADADELFLDAFDGTQWTNLRSWSTVTGDEDDAWHGESFDLAAYLEQTDFRIRLRVRNDSSSDRVQLDDIRIQAFAPECDLDTDCDDAEPCTADVCSDAVCLHLPVDPGASCPGGVCDGSGECIECLVDEDCPDVACAEPRTCQSEVCSAVVSVDCDDMNDCTADVCADAVDACVHTDLAPHVPCAGGVCDGSGACIGCLIDSDCDTPCGSGRTCNTATSTCTGSETSSTNCNDNNSCTADSCDAQLGCQHTPTNSGVSCGGGRTCDASGHCAECTSNAQCPMGEQCVAGDCECVPQSCDDLPGQCGVIVVDCGATITCDCPAGETCQAGSCVEHCEDGIRSLDEPGRDCGSDCPEPCTELACADGQDADHDGLTDCEDPDCVDAGQCEPCLPRLLATASWPWDNVSITGSPSSLTFQLGGTGCGWVATQTSISPGAADHVDMDLVDDFALAHIVDCLFTAERPVEIMVVEVGQTVEVPNELLFPLGTDAGLATTLRALVKHLSFAGGRMYLDFQWQVFGHPDRNGDCVACPPFDAMSPSATFCSERCRCDVGEGGCTHDRQCERGLVCDPLRGGRYAASMEDTSVCMPPKCGNGVQDADEDGIDCGGICGACPTDCADESFCSSTCPCPDYVGACRTDVDCFSGSVCGHDNGRRFDQSGNVCWPATCANGVRDSGETGVDCGNARCGPCDDCEYQVLTCGSGTAATEQLDFTFDRSERTANATQLVGTQFQLIGAGEPRRWAGQTGELVLFEGERTNFARRSIDAAVTTWTDVNATGTGVASAPLFATVSAPAPAPGGLRYVPLTSTGAGNNQYRFQSVNVGVPSAGQPVVGSAYYKTPSGTPQAASLAVSVGASGAGLPTSTSLTNTTLAQATTAVFTLSGGDFLFAGDSRLGSSDAKHFNCASVTTTKDVFYRFHLNAAATVTVETLGGPYGTSFDTVVGLFPVTATVLDQNSRYDTGDLGPGGTAITCTNSHTGSDAVRCCDNDGNGNSWDSKFQAALDAGDYFVAVTGDAAGQEGPFQIRFRDVSSTLVASSAEVAATSVPTTTWTRRDALTTLQVDDAVKLILGIDEWDPFGDTSVVTAASGYIVHVAAPQLELGSFPSSWIATGHYALTRDKDRVTLPRVRVPQWMRDGVGTSDGWLVEVAPIFADEDVDSTPERFVLFEFGNDQSWLGLESDGNGSVRLVAEAAGARVETDALDFERFDPGGSTDPILIHVNPSLGELDATIGATTYSETGDAWTWLPSDVTVGAGRNDLVPSSAFAWIGPPTADVAPPLTCSTDIYADQTPCGLGASWCEDGECLLSAACGDGRLDANDPDSPVEGCDDGNNLPGDGCSAECMAEPGAVVTRNAAQAEPTETPFHDLAQDGMGRALLVWQGKTGEGNATRVFARRLTASGISQDPGAIAWPIAGPLDAAWPAEPRVVGLSEGWVVVWTEPGADLTQRSDVKFRTVAVDGTLGPITSVSEEFPVARHSGRIAPVGDGFVVAWLNAATGTEHVSVRARIFDAAGDSDALPFAVSAQSGADQLQPALASRGQRWALAWTDTLSGDVMLRRFDGTQGQEAPTAIGADGHDAALAALPPVSGSDEVDFTVAWVSSVDRRVHAVELLAGATPNPAQAAAVSPAGMPATTPATAGLGRSFYLVSWTYAGLPLDSDFGVFTRNGQWAPTPDLGVAQLGNALQAPGSQWNLSLRAAEHGTWFVWRDDTVFADDLSLGDIPTGLRAFVLGCADCELSWGETCFLDEGKLVPSDLSGSAPQFGTAVAISGDRALVSAATDTSAGAYAGSVYVLHHTGSAWEVETKLLPSAPVANGWMGNFVSISGTRAIVGAAGDGSVAGAAYIYELTGGTWTEQVKLTVPGSIAVFGGGASIRGNVAVAAALGGVATVHVYRLVGGQWAEEAVLTQPDPELLVFGYGIALGDNELFVLGRTRDGATNLTNGHVYHYVYNPTTTTWTLMGELPADQAQESDSFGAAHEGIALDGDTLLVGAPLRDGVFTNEGAVVVYRRSGSTWQWKQTLHGTATNQYFGWSTAVDGLTAAVGSQFFSIIPVGVGPSTQPGQVDVYRLDEQRDRWQHARTLAASDAGGAAIGYGMDVALGGGHLLTGALNAPGAGYMGTPGASYGYFCSAGAHCGDGVLWAGVEECDDGNRIAADGCEPSCLFEPQVVAESDLEGRTDVEPLDPLVVTFPTAPLDALSVTPDTLVLRDEAGESIPYTFDIDDDILEITPTSGLALRAYYTLSVTDDLADTNGAHPYSTTFSFRTRDGAWHPNSLITTGSVTTYSEIRAQTTESGDTYVAWNVSGTLYFVRRNGQTRQWGPHATLVQVPSGQEVCLFEFAYVASNGDARLVWQSCGTSAVSVANVLDFDADAGTWGSWSTSQAICTTTATGIVKELAVAGEPPGPQVVGVRGYTCYLPAGSSQWQSPVSMHPGTYMQLLMDGFGTTHAIGTHNPFSDATTEWMTRASGASSWSSPTPLMGETVSLVSTSDPEGGFETLALNGQGQVRTYVLPPGAAAWSSPKLLRVSTSDLDSNLRPRLHFGGGAALAMWRELTTPIDVAAAYRPPSSSEWDDAVVLSDVLSPSNAGNAFCGVVDAHGNAMVVVNQFGGEAHRRGVDDDQWDSASTTTTIGSGGGSRCAMAVDSLGRITLAQIVFGGGLRLSDFE